MNTKPDIHLTGMSQELSRDFSGNYRRKLLDQIKLYQKKLSVETFPSIQRALQHAETILATE